MPIIDLLIAVAIVISVIVGVFRGFFKEAISIAALLAAIWAALFFGPGIGEFSDKWISSPDLQAWFGRVLVFAVALLIGGLLGWVVSKLVKLSLLGGVDRLAGAAFGAARGVLLAALFVLGGQYAEFEKYDWWQRSNLIPPLEVVAEWIKIMAPQGYEIMVPGEVAI
jgi:membrane protein required for colicin V production